MSDHWDTRASYQARKLNVSRWGLSVVPSSAVNRCWYRSRAERAAAAEVAARLHRPVIVVSVAEVAMG